MKVVLFFMVFIVTSGLSQAGRIASFKEYKILDAPAKGVRRADNADIEFYLQTIERLEKLQDEAIEMRDMYKEMVEMMFGLKLSAKTTTTPRPNVLGSARRASEEWVRSSQDLSVLNSKSTDKYSH